MIRVRWKVAALVSLVFVVSACDSGPPVGAERGACYGNGTCDEGLMCASGICVEAVALGDSPGVDSQPSEPADPVAAVPVADAPVADTPGTTAGSPTPVVPPTPADPSAGAAEAYTAFINAWNTHDSATYFSLFNPVLDCWYGARNRPVQQVAEGSRGTHFRETGIARIAQTSFNLLGQSGDRFVFVDEGSVVGSSGATPHRKIIAMVQTPQGWRIAGEVGPDERTCPFYASLPPVQPARPAPEPEQAQNAAARPPGGCGVRGMHDGYFEGVQGPPQRLDSASRPLPCAAGRAQVDALADRLSYERNAEVTAEYDAQGRVVELYISFSMADEGSEQWSYRYE